MSVADGGAPRKIGRGIWRGVYSAIVDHPDFQSLTPNARLTLLVCRVGSLNTAASIFRYYLEPLQEQTGLTREELVAGPLRTRKETQAFNAVDRPRRVGVVGSQRFEA